MQQGSRSRGRNSSTCVLVLYIVFCILCFIFVFFALCFIVIVLDFIFCILCFTFSVLDFLCFVHSSSVLPFVFAFCVSFS